MVAKIQPTPMNKSSARSLGNPSPYLSSSGSIIALCPEYIGDIGVKLWTREKDFITSIVDNALIGSPKDKLVSTFGNRDAHKVTKENPVACTVVFPDFVQGVFVGGEGGLDDSIDFHGESISNAELLSDFLGRKF